MANYTFRCLECGYEYNTKCSIEKRSEQVCPKCRSVKQEQLFTNINVNKTSGVKKTDIPSCAAQGCCPGCQYHQH